MHNEISRKVMRRFIKKIISLIAQGKARRKESVVQKYFDKAFYLDANPDVRDAGVEPLAHYLEVGWKEGRSPHPRFDTLAYLQDNPDVAASKTNPLRHYVAHGRAEERRTTRIPDLMPVFERVAREASTPFALARPPAPDVSVIIPVHGKADMTLCCLYSLSRHRSRHAFEVIVVDDGSPDDTPDILARVEGLILRRRAAAGGFIAACNDGVELASGRQLVFLNNDTVVLDGWLDELVEAFDVLPTAGAVGSQLIYPSGHLQESGAVVWRDGSATNLGRYGDPGAPGFSHAREVDYCSAASLMIPADLFRSLGGFDPRYAPAYYEDTDLCLRIRESGRRVYCQPLSRVIHVEGGTAGTDLNQGAKRHQVINRETFLKRWASVLPRHPEPAAVDPYAMKRPGQRRILVVDHALPEPDADAGSVVTMEIIRLFQRIGYLVAFASAHPPADRDDRVRALERMGVMVVRGPYFPTTGDFIRRYGHACDLIMMVRHPVAAGLLPHVHAVAPQPPVILLNADLHYLRAERQAALYADAAMAEAAAAEKKEELAIIRNVAATITHSTVEREILRAEAPGRLVEVLPWIATPAQHVPGPEGRRDILFVGGFSHLPNVDAMVWFVANLWPRIRKRLPGVTLRIAGSNPGPAVYALRQEDVLVLGHVENLRAEIDRARVSIAPLRWGAGLKGKVATMMAMGLPGVVSPVAAESMGIVDGRDCLIAELDGTFVDAVERLYTDDRLWSDLSRDGRDFVARHWSPDCGIRVLRSLLSRIRVPPPYALSDQIEAIARQRRETM